MSSIKAMVSTDFAVMRGSLASTACLGLVVAIAMVVGMRSLIPPLAAVSAMVPIISLTTLGAYDEYNNWNGFRLTLPLSRQHVVFGRYLSLAAIMALSGAASLAIGLVAQGAFSLIPMEFAAQLTEGATLASMAASIAVALSCAVLASAVTLPLALRFGMTSAVRLIPVVATVAFALLLVITGSSGSPFEGSEAFANLLLWLDATDTHLLAAAAAILAISLALYAASALLAAHLYETREL